MSYQGYHYELAELQRIKKELARTVAYLDKRINHVTKMCVKKQTEEVNKEPTT